MFPLCDGVEDVTRFLLTQSKRSHHHRDDVRLIPELEEVLVAESEVDVLSGTAKRVREGIRTRRNSVNNIKLRIVITWL